MHLLNPAGIKARFRPRDFRFRRNPIRAAGLRPRPTYSPPALIASRCAAIWKMIGMHGGSRIIDLRTGNAPAADDDLLLTEELPAPSPAPIEAPMVQEYEQEEGVAPSRSGLVMPIIGALVSLGWVGARQPQ